MQDTTSCLPPATEPTRQEFLNRLGIDPLCLICPRQGHGRIIIRRHRDGQLFVRRIWQFESVCSFILIVGMRAKSCISPHGREPGTITIKAARWHVFMEAANRILDERELIESDLLTRDELKSIGLNRTHSTEGEPCC